MTETQGAAVTPADRMLVKGLMTGSWVAQACYVTAKLGIPDLLVDGARSVEDLAAAVEADELALYRVLRALSTVDVVVEEKPRCFGLTPTGHALRPDVPGSLHPGVLMFGEQVFPLFTELEHTVRTGEPAFEKIHGQPFYAYMAAAPERSAAMVAARSEAAGVPAVLAKCDLDGAKTVADLGGGNGSVLAEVLKAQPGARGLLLERPEVVELARPVLRAAAVEERCELLAGDFFEEIPAADAYLAVRVLRNWDDDQALRLLTRIREAARPGARLLVVEKVVPDAPEYHPAKVDDLLMLVLVHGRDRTEGEHRELLAAAGFDLRAVHRVPVDLDAEAAVEAVVR